VKEESEGHADRVETARDAGRTELPHTATVDVQPLEAWCDVPDVYKGDPGELAAPLGGDTDTATGGHDEIADLLP